MDQTPRGRKKTDPMLEKNADRRGSSSKSRRSSGSRSKGTRDLISPGRESIIHQKSRCQIIVQLWSSHRQGNVTKVWG